MQRMTALLLLVVAVSALVGAAGAFERLQLEIDGMVCPLCERAVESILRAQPGVLEADADFRTGRAVVVYDPARITPQEIAEAVSKKSFYRAWIIAPGQGAAARRPAQ